MTSPETAVQPAAKETRRQDYLSIVARQFRKNRVAMVGLGIVLILFAIAISADFLANDRPLVMRYEGELRFPIIRGYAVRLGLVSSDPQFQNVRFKLFADRNFGEDDWAIFPPIRYSPDETNLLANIRPPSGEHFLGTDDLGRDVASRMVHGSRVSLSVGFVAVSIYVAIGLVVGALAGFYGGIVDVIASRLIEIMLTIPTFFLIITAMAFLRPSVFNIMVVIGLTGWPTVARLTRGEFLKLKSQDYVIASRALGAGDMRTIVYHVLPNAVAPVFVAATFGVATAILVESTLSFLGFGVPPTQASWGLILNSARPLLPSGWWLTLFPGLAIFLTVTSYNLVGEGLRDAADPRLKSR
jgi:peptide/nickel transport system permease protein